MKYVIEITEIPACPENWTSAKAWDSPGIYVAKTEPNYVYVVTESGVSFINPIDILTHTPYVDPGHVVPESLLLKAIAAAASRELKV